MSPAPTYLSNSTQLAGPALSSRSATETEQDQSALSPTFPAFSPTPSATYTPASDSSPKTVQGSAFPSDDGLHHKASVDSNAYHSPTDQVNAPSNTNSQNTRSFSAENDTRAQAQPSTSLHSATTTADIATAELDGYRSPVVATGVVHERKSSSNAGNASLPSSDVLTPPVASGIASDGKEAALATNGTGVPEAAASFPAGYALFFSSPKLYLFTYISCCQQIPQAPLRRLSE